METAKPAVEPTESTLPSSPTPAKVDMHAQWQWTVHSVFASIFQLNTVVEKNTFTIMCAVICNSFSFHQLKLFKEDRYEVEETLVSDMAYAGFQ